MGLERGPLSLVSTTEELLERESSGSGLENQDYGRRDAPRSLRNTSLATKVGTNIVDKRRSLCRYSSLADSGDGVWFIGRRSGWAVLMYVFHARLEWRSRCWRNGTKKPSRRCHRGQLITQKTESITNVKYVANKQVN
jgi:hypothetical protein